MVLEQLQGKRILVAGGGGFLGRNVVQSLKQYGVPERNILISHSKEHDLRLEEEAYDLIALTRPDIVICLAARLSGIGDNLARPAQYFLDNIHIGLNLIEASRKARVTKFVYTGSVCGYPREAAIPFSEKDMWDGYPEPANAPYGIAKKAVGIYLEAAYKQYGFKGVQLILTNLYGPEDDFRDSTSHVIPALIKKTVHAKAFQAPHINAWGDGSPTRDFLHVRDAAEGIVRATALHAEPSPINLGSGTEVSICELMSQIKSASEYEGEIQWDSKRPNGQPRRVLDISKARELFGFEPKITLMDGLRETIAWYVANQTKIDALPYKYRD